MSDPRVPKMVYFLMLLKGLLAWTRAYPQLPNRMASHFDIYGRPNGWQPKEAFFLTMALAIVATGAIGFLLPRAIAAAPAGLINLPRRDYWLAPDRREATFRFLRSRFAWFACGALFVLLYAASEAINANLPDHGPFLARGMLYVLAGFLLVTAAGTVDLFRHFSSAPPQHSAAAK